MVMTSQCPIVSIYLDIKGEHKVSMFVEFQSQMNLFIFFVLVGWKVICATPIAVRVIIPKGP